MIAHRKPAPNEVFPANGTSVPFAQPAVSRRDLRRTLDEMPHMVEAMAPAPVLEETLDNVPSYAGPSTPAPSTPAPRH